MKRMVFIVKFTALLAIIASIFGCNAKPEILDGPGSVYVDSDYRTEYANTLDFDSHEDAYWAVSFLGYGEDLSSFREKYVSEIFGSLSAESIEKIQHFEYEGDEWYLVIPRYMGYNDIVNTDTGLTATVYNGEAFTIRCNPSDLQSNIEISIDTHGGNKFSPVLDGDGRLVCSESIWDITDYNTLTYNPIQKGE